jgi:hypothetical protein
MVNITLAKSKEPMNPSQLSEFMIIPSVYTSQGQKKELHPWLRQNIRRVQKTCYPSSSLFIIIF